MINRDNIIDTAAPTTTSVVIANSSALTAPAD